MSNVSVLVNQLASLYCEVEGTPSPVIMWFKDDIQVNADTKRVQFSALYPDESFVCEFLLSDDKHRFSVLTVEC